MRRMVAVVTAALTAALLVVMPTGAAPAQAAAAFAPGSSLNNPANAPILVELGVLSAGGTTAATGATAAAVATGASGTTGFVTVVGASVAAVGLMTLKGVEEGLFVQTDPEYVDPGSAGELYPVASVGSTTLQVLGYAPRQTWHPSAVWHTYTRTCLAISGPLSSGGARVWFSYAATPQTGSAGGSYTFAGTGGPVGVYAQSTWFRPYTGPFTGSARSPSSVACPTGTTHYLEADSGTSLAPYNDWSPQIYPTMVGLGTSAGVSSDATPIPVSEGYHGTIRTTVTCAGADGTTYVEAFAEVDVDQGENLPVPPAACPAGSMAIHAAVDYQANGTTTWVGIGSMTAPSYVEGLPVDYPDCFNGNLTCAVQLWKVGAGGTLASCGPIGEFCPTWATEATVNPDLYRCSYGPYELPLANCSMYRSPGVGVLPNDSGETDTNGKRVPLPINAPVPDPLPNPLVDRESGEPASSAPWIDTDGSTRPERTNCWPTGWGVLNPLSWVLTPIQCALEWAFVPRASEINLKLEQLRFQVNGWVAPAVAVVTAITASINFAASGCQGPPLHLDMDFGPLGGFDETFYPMSACDPPMDAVASAVNGMISFSVVAATGLAAVRYFMALFGYVPFGNAGGSTVAFRDRGDE